EHREKNAGGEPGADQRLEVHRLAPSRRPAGLAIGSPVGLFAACRGAPAFTGSITRKTRSACFMPRPAVGDRNFPGLSGCRSAAAKSPMRRDAVAAFT